MKITREDVAKEAGVSAQTVSYVLNNKRKFSDALVKKVMDAVEKLHYKPNMLATGLKTKITKTICLVVEDIANPVFTEMMLGFEHSAVEQGYFISLIHAKSDYKNLARNIVERFFDGIYLSLLPSENMEDFVKTVTENGIKVVLGNKMQFADPEICTSYVEVDTYNGVKKLIEYLNSRGHIEIVYLSGLDTANSTDMRFCGFCDGMKEIAGVSDPLYVEAGFPYETTAAAGRQLAREAWERYRPTAMIATNDLMALGAISYLKEIGVDVPGDVSVVGIDNTTHCEFSTPRLTSLGFDKEEYGRLLFLSLLGQLEESEVRNGKVECFVYERDSVKSIR